MAARTFSQAMSEAARDSGRTDQEIAADIRVSKGYFSRLMRHVGEQWARRLVAFMVVTGSDAPLRWIETELQRERASRGVTSSTGWPRAATTMQVNP